MGVLDRLLRRRGAEDPILPRMPSVSEVERLIDEADQAEDRYVETGDLVALERALHAREAILAHPALRVTGELRVMLLTGIGSASERRYWATGSEEDLNRAVQMFDEAVGSSPPGYRELPGILTNLGNALRDRHLRFGERRDLDRMMRCLERAVDETPEAGPVDEHDHDRDAEDHQSPEGPHK